MGWMIVTPDNLLTFTSQPDPPQVGQTVETEAGLVEVGDVLDETDDAAQWARLNVFPDLVFDEQ